MAWAGEEKKISPTTMPATRNVAAAPPAEVSECSPAGLLTPEWLYASKKLDLEWLPNVPLWAAPVISIGPATFYRLTAGVLVWLEAAGQSLERSHLAGELPKGQMEAYLAAMDVVWRFAGENLAVEAVRAARGKPPRLPEREWRTAG